MTGCAFGWALFAAQASAEAEPSGADSALGDVELTYDAPAGCPSRAEFVARLRARRRGRPTVDSPSSPRRVEVRVDRAADVRATARVAITDAGGTATTRRIVAASCSEAVDAAALVVALTLDPMHTEAPAEGTEPAPAEPSASSPSGGTSPGETPGATAKQGAAKHAATPEPRASPATGQGAEEAERVNASAAPARVDSVVAASLLLASGLTPDAAFGGQLAARFSLPDAPLHPSVRAGARAVLSDTVARSSGTAVFDWWAGLLALCAGTSPSPSLTLHGCASLELGQLSAAGRNTRNPASERRLWAAVGPALTGEWALLAPLTLLVGVEALFPFRHQRFLFGTDVVYEVQAVALRGEVGLGLAF